MRGRGRTAAFLAAALAAGWLTVAAAGEPIPAPEELEARGAVIGDIFLVPEDIFDTSIPGESGWLYRAQLKHFPITPEVHVRPDEKGLCHTLAITAGDRPGLLYAIAFLFSKYRLDLHTAKIVTLGERAEDVFLVSGEALGNSRVMLQLEQELLEVLQ